MTAIGTTTDQPDIRTSQIPMRQVMDGDTLRLYPGVQWDGAIDDRQVKTKAGRAFGRLFISEPLAVSDDMAFVILAGHYGPLTASDLLRRASKEGYVYGPEQDFYDDRYRYSTGINVASDKSRESGYVLQYKSLRRRGRKVSG